jgi:DNA-binding beta-propeller fold protein YncE
MARIKLTISVFCLLFTGMVTMSQDTVMAGYNSDGKKDYIKWVSQFPDLNSDNKTSGGKKIINYLFGKNELEIVIKPVGIVGTDPENYWIIDQGGGTIFKIKDNVGEITHFKNKTYKEFPSLVGICELPNSKMLFSDSYLNKLFTFLPDKKELNILNDTLMLDRPTGVAYSSVNQEIWVLETNAHRVTVLNEKGQIVKRIGKRGTAPGEFNFPTYIWIDKFGKVFIVDAMNFRVQVFSPDGKVISVFGKAGDASGSFARPRGIATDSDGNIYVADALFNSVQIFDIDGNFLYDFGMQGQDKGRFWMPAGIFIDENDFIYVADTYNSRVQIFKYLK